MKYLIWDFDGTLAFREGMWSGTLAQVACECIPGCRAQREDFVPHLQSGFPWHAPHQPHRHIRSSREWWDHLAPVLCQALVKVLRVRDDQARGLLPRIRTEYLNVQRWSVFADTLPCLQALREAGWRHVILSNHVPELAELVAGLGIAHQIERIFTSAAIGYEKPHPEAFRVVLAALPARGAKLMVGDSYETDIQGAAAVGIEGVLVRTSNPQAPVFYRSLLSLAAALAGA